MARNANRGQVRTRAMQLANVVNDPSFQPADVNELINLHWPAVYDQLIAAGPADYYTAETPITTTAGLSVYALPTDFFALTNVLVQESGSYLRPLDPMGGDRQRQHYQPCQVTGATVILEYIPTAPTFDDDADTFDGVDGWDELLSAKVARDIVIKRQGDVTPLMAIIAGTEKRIQSFAKGRQRMGPKLLPDVESDICWPYSVQIDAWRLRGDNIELFTALFGPYIS